MTTVLIIIATIIMVLMGVGYSMASDHEKEG